MLFSLSPYINLSSRAEYRAGQPWTESCSKLWFLSLLFCSCLLQCWKSHRKWDTVGCGSGHVLPKPVSLLERSIKACGNSFMCCSGAYNRSGRSSEAKHPTRGVGTTMVRPRWSRGYSHTAVEVNHSCYLVANPVSHLEHDLRLSQLNLIILD